MHFFNILSITALAMALLLSSCVTPIPAQPGQAKLRAGPGNFATRGPLILVEKVDGQPPVFDERDRSAILTPGPHVVEVKTIADQSNQPGELLLLLIEAFGSPPPPPPQTVHSFTAESGHDYFFRWAFKDDKVGDAIWIEDYNRGGQVVSGSKPSKAHVMRDPFAK